MNNTPRVFVSDKLIFNYGLSGSGNINEMRLRGFWEIRSLIKFVVCLPNMVLIGYLKLSKVYDIPLDET